MNRRIAKLLSVLLLSLAIAVTQIPVSDVEATGSTSDFQIEGSKLLKYTGTAEVVSIPDNVKEIGEEAFAGNDYLVKVTIGGKVEKIDHRAFADCDNLRTIDVGDSVTEIGQAAFSNNNTLCNVSLGAGLKKLGDGVFAGSGQLSTLSLSKDNTYLYYKDGVLYDNEQKILYALMPNYEKKTFALPGTVERISAYAFWGNPYLEAVMLDSNLQNVPAYAFSNCINLREVEIPLPIRSIEAKAFEDCVNLQKAVLPDSMSRIHDTAFDGCVNVRFRATPGTYGAEFAATFKTLEPERIEYEETLESEVISADEITEPQPTAETEIEVETGSYVSPTIMEENNSGRLLGQSSIVAGRAVIFIDNRLTYVSMEDESNTSIGNLLSDNAEKGKDFPKYTIAGDKIASQAYYQDSELTEYVIEDGIRQIGDFAFARTGLTSITIPDGVEKIGYGAFYHCDSLSNVTIPSSVREIEANALTNTPWLSEMQSNAGSPYVIVGDGILLAYSGTDSVVNIPDGVKQIGAEVFKDRMGITAVNIPDSVTVIGEAAFSGCKNLKTVNGGSRLIAVCDRAFQNCPLSQISIPATMEKIGLGAYDCPGGTDTIIFEGTELPVLTMGENSGRLSNADSRTYAFEHCKNAIVPEQVTDLKGTVLEPGIFGFHGTVTNDAGTFLTDSSQGAVQIASSGVSLKINSRLVADNRENAMATMPGNSGNYVLRITDSDSAAEKIASSYSELYGGREPSGLIGFDISLFDSTGQIPITKLGRQYITIQIPRPDGVTEDGFHLVTLDGDGQMEAVEYQIVNLEDGDYIQFRTKHFSPYGMYRYSGYAGQGFVNGGKAYISLPGNKDNTPDTGDGIHPKWILALGLLGASIALFFYRGKHRKKIIE